MSSDGRNELYSIVADRYAFAQKDINTSQSEMYDAIHNLVVENDSLQAKEDCFGSAVATYESFQNISDNLIPAIRSLTSHVLRTSNFSDINEFLLSRKIKVRHEWAVLSNAAGYPIENEFIGVYDAISS